MREDQTQLFKMEYGTRCDTFGCGEAGAYFVGRPDGPLNTSHILCQTCTDSLVESVTKLFGTQQPVDLQKEINADWIGERLAETKTHAVLDEIIGELGLVGVPNREEAKLQERKDAIAAAVR